MTSKFIRYASRASLTAVRSKMSFAIAVRLSGVRIDGGNAVIALSKRLPKPESSSGSNTPLYCSNDQLLFVIALGSRTSSRRLAAVGPKEVGPAARSDEDAMRLKVMRYGNTAARCCVEIAGMYPTCTIDQHSAHCG